ncbi:HDL214Wp [Eremothecium sinecaudum]|uniref:HDL214Wp n=1 Tax=Eremothecium sinecaudum TaxID=45286 RepID=A0A0X8HS91_9SACH|nr:HDL214Wp [Eremothecium sinecaudum]AMD20530.1 HDL214Wp [Eremothecium sinecaudum]
MAMKLNVQKDPTGLSISFHARSSRFYYQWLFNFIIWASLQIVGYILICNYFLGMDALFAKIIYSIVTLLLIRAPTIDSFYVFKDYGVQLKTSKGCILLPEFLNCKIFDTTIFIPNDEIVDVVINEGFQGLSVIFYLCVIVKKSKVLKLVFPVCEYT